MIGSVSDGARAQTDRPRGGPAVMARRREPAASLDDFPTPPWAVRALTEWLQNPCDRLLPGSRRPEAPTTSVLSCREPAAGRGHMARALAEAFGEVHQIDIHDYGTGNLDTVADYLDEPFWPFVDWTITNPPFRLAERFIRHALSLSEAGVAMLVRTQFLEGVGRHERLFARHPPTAVLQFAERVPMVRGRLDPKASTATSYCWLVWDLCATGPTQLVWLPPCRRRLEREEDWT
ncbi:methyltransferase [Tabrizicola thermarum]|uniref:methyltransferase n=1 Tax=Tabrizicola thermarum TaxID=2670345 RepID=UPI000FFC1115|nr:methyltransferase [Tabrizicola thermarum]